MTEKQLAAKADKIISKEHKVIKKQRSRLASKGHARMLADEYNETFIKDRVEHGEEVSFDLTQYVQCNRHRQGCPAYLKIRHFDVLIRYTPGPLGLGMDVKAIAKDMKLSRRQIHRILLVLKVTHPSVINKIGSMRRVMFRQGGSINKKARSYEGILAAFDMKAYWESQEEGIEKPSYISLVGER